MVCCSGSVVFRGFLRKTGRWTWFFGGQDVVFRLVKPDTGRTLFDRSKILQFFRIYLKCQMSGAMLPPLK
jgi:hypothetical protein